MNESPPNALALAELLVQVRPANTTAAAGFTAPTGVTGVRFSITRINICNTSGAAATYRLFHDDDGTTFDETTALAWDEPIPANGVRIWEAQSPSSGISLKSGGSLGVRTSVNSALTFSIYGTVGRSR